MPVSFGLYKNFKFSELVDPAVLYGDHFVFNYSVSDGSDLDIAFRFLTPQIEGFLGWGKQNTLTVGTKVIATWGGDNTGLGSESVYINKENLFSAFPNTPYIELDLRAFWYGSVGLNPVVVNMDAYQEGIVVKDGFSFINPTATNAFPSSKSFAKIINTFSNNSESIGERVSRSIINFESKTVSYFSN